MTPSQAGFEKAFALAGWEDWIDIELTTPTCWFSGATNGGLYVTTAAGRDAFRVSVNGQPVTAPIRR